MGSCTFHPAAKSFPPGYAAIYMRLPPLYTRMYHIRLPRHLHAVVATLHPDVSHPKICYCHIPSDCRHFTPGCITSENLLPPPFHPDVLHPEFRSRMGEEATAPFDSTHGSLALKAYQQNLYLEYYY